MNRTKNSKNNPIKKNAYIKKNDYINETNPDIVEVQFKLIKNQARNTGIASVVAIIISILALFLSYFEYHNDNQELIKIKTELFTENYIPTIWHIVPPLLLNLTVNEDTIESLIRIKYNCEIINLSRLPITIDSYYLIDETELRDINLEKINWKSIFTKKVNNEFKYTFSKNDLPNSVKIEEASNYEMNFGHSFSISKNIIHLLDSEIKHNSLNKFRTDSIYDIMHLLYKNKTDFFGNILNCSFQESGGFSYSYSRDQIFNDSPFFIVFKTAKGHYFSKRVTWFNQSPDILPFSDFKSKM